MRTITLYYTHNLSPSIGEFYEQSAVIVAVTGALNVVFDLESLHRLRHDVGVNTKPVREVDLAPWFLAGTNEYAQFKRADSRLNFQVAIQPSLEKRVNTAQFEI